MKTLLLALLASLPLYAQTPDRELYSPTDALKDINTGKLVLMGRQIFPGFGQNYTCVYKSETAYILYNNCMGNKKESPALDLEVISYNGDIVSFFIQNNDATVAVSNTVRANYSMTWRVSVVVSAPISKNLTIAEVKQYKEKYGDVSSGCSIGSTFKAQDMDAKSFCYGGVKNPTWQLAADTFWKEPSDEWYATQKYLRKVVEGK